MAKAFTKIDASIKRTVKYHIRLTEQEAETIRTSALVRKLSVADFMRRAALARKADVNYETEIVRGLTGAITEMKEMTTVMRELKITLPVEEIREIWASIKVAITKVDNL